MSLVDVPVKVPENGIAWARAGLPSLVAEVPEARVELATPRFSAACSTTELPRQPNIYSTVAPVRHARRT